MTELKSSAMDMIIKHVESLQYDDLPESTIDAAKTFILDSIGVGISGSRIAEVEQIKSAVSQWGQGRQAQVWVTGEWLPAVSAAAVNGYHIHNQEWDCVHEPAVVHPMAVILSSLMAYAQAHDLSGKQLILGIVIAVDVATLIGQSVTSALKFFRPSICGCLGASAGLCAIQGHKGEILKNTMGIAYSQISGTMQSHVEGSPMLAMQIGMNAQSALRAIDLAEAGFKGPHDILEGPFGYFNLFEDTYDLTPMIEKLGHQFQIERVSHKPFPTGRAGHGTVDGLLTLQQEHLFSADDIEKIDVYATPLINRLVGRPVKKNMNVSYAKLCNGYIAACALLSGNVSVDDFTDEALKNKHRLALARKVNTHLNDCNDPNALAPVKVVVTLKNGLLHEIDLPNLLGSPDKPLSREAQLVKFKTACRSAKLPISNEKIDLLIKRIDELEQVANISRLVEQLVF